MKRSIELFPALALAIVVTACTVPSHNIAPDAAIVLMDVGPRPDAFHMMCDPGFVECAGTCTRLAADSSNCGSCGNACPTGTTCAVGRCDCIAPMIACDGLCIDPTSDPEHCNTCDNACASTEICSASECIVMCTAANHRVCVNTDSSGERTQICADLFNDPMNCGTCNTVCAGGATCVDGVCACPAGETACSGACVDTSTDPNNCGSCLSSCGAGGTCSGGVCTSCGPGLQLCGSPQRCIDTNTSRLHCGLCGHACEGGEACTGGMCECEGALVDCGTGCTDLQTNPEHCSDCATTCGPGGACAAGVCTCIPSLTLCSGSCRNTTTDLNNCGACDYVCPPLVGGVCAGGVCGCPAGTTDCGGVCANTMTDRNHCGACPTVCPGSFVCLMGGCTDAPPTRYMQTTPTVAEAPWIDACAAPGHLTVLTTTDDGSVLEPLPFAFRYWATNLAAGSMVNMSSNGFMSMEAVASARYYGVSIPSTSTPYPVIAAHWGDDYTRATGICVATVGTAPNRQFVVEWNDSHYCCSDDAVHNTFEIVLSEGTNYIDILFQSMATTRAQVTGVSDYTGSMGVSGCPGAAATCIPASGDRVRFLPIP